MKENGMKNSLLIDILKYYYEKQNLEEFLKRIQKNL